MKIIFSFLLFLLAININASENNFTDYFLDETMRIDYHHMGNSEIEMISIDKIYRYGVWAGSIVNLVDNLNNGKYYLKIYDLESEKLIYSKGFDTYFGEYQTSEEAIDGIKKTYHESAIIPYPKNRIRFSIEKRDKKNILAEIFSAQINPEDQYIVKDKVKDSSIKLINYKNNGDPHSKIDIAVLGDGYTKNEGEKFKKDFNRLVKTLFEIEPYKSLNDKFNFYGVLKYSEESGADEPGANIYKNTSLGTTFYSLGSERYLLTEENKTLRNIAANVPYDALVIIVNHNRYGGGGIYNLFCTLTSDNQWFEYLFLHEFGHSFSGLADEYYTSDVAYSEFYKIDVEPVEPNLTALVNPKEFKWKEFVKDVEIPTLWEKAQFDSMDMEWQSERREMNQKIAELKRNNVDSKEVENFQDEYNRKDKLHSEEIDDFLKNSKYSGKIGVFEGAGYLSKCLYRPMVDCLMFSKGKKPYCIICEKAVLRVISSYSE
ncbi:MAG TPA: M64 family metallopeptidase [Ignavibacteriaceae bacterium]|nr:M64 family metallopeptidase [Ignavibacteriaceae bacterium]